MGSYGFSSTLLANRLCGKTHVVMNVERPGAVLIKKFSIAALELCGITPAQ